MKEYKFINGNKRLGLEEGKEYNIEVISVVDDLLTVKIYINEEEYIVCNYYNEEEFYKEWK